MFAIILAVNTQQLQLPAVGQATFLLIYGVKMVCSVHGNTIRGLLLSLFFLVNLAVRESLINYSGKYLFVISSTTSIF